MRYAIIDCGTNTFNLLVAEPHNGSYNVIYQTKIPVKLGEGGILNKVIKETPFRRGVEALRNYSERAIEYKCDKVVAFATSAIREASNGKDFAETVLNETGIQIQIISGDEEAELIYKGVQLALELGDRPSLIMDIGGGSTEFVIANKQGLIWEQSFLLGVSRLLEAFKPTDPISTNDLQALHAHLDEQLKPLALALEKNPVVELIGSSGSFDSLAEMIAHRFYSPNVLQGKTEYVFNLNDYRTIAEEMLSSTLEQRKQIKGLVAMRVDMIVLGVVLVNYILNKFDIKQMRLSTYSLKEGVLNELMTKEI